MTMPDLSQVMPFGVTYIPTVAWAPDYMEIDKSISPVPGTSSGLNVPPVVFTLHVASSMVGDTYLQISYLDGSPSRRTKIFTDGGRYMETLSGTNINILRLGNSETAANMAAGRRATMQIIPIPNPV